MVVVVVGVVSVGVVIGVLDWVVVVAGAAVVLGVVVALEVLLGRVPLFALAAGALLAPGLVVVEELLVVVPVPPELVEPDEPDVSLGLDEPEVLDPEELDPEVLEPDEPDVSLGVDEPEVLEGGEVLDGEELGGAELGVEELEGDPPPWLGAVLCGGAGRVARGCGRRFIEGNVDGSRLVTGVLEPGRWRGMLWTGGRPEPRGAAPRGSTVDGWGREPAVADVPAAATCPPVAGAGAAALALRTTSSSAGAGWCEAPLPDNPRVPGSDPSPARTPPPMAPIASRTASTTSGAPSAPEVFAAAPMWDAAASRGR
ncbi:MAG TPA: hypothetical protein VMP89_01455 [Solirubrobacteraceae bacterium]|nr:hypothetical protein [Solirubrobacteraceae bacterium]